MHSKEIVYKTIELKDPPRLPICYFNRDLDLSDTYAVTYKQSDDFASENTHQTEWGYIWEVLDGTMGQPHSHPLKNWETITAYIPPDPFASGRLDHVLNEIEPYWDKFIKFSMGISGFNQATFLRGFEDFLTDLYVEPKQAKRVLDIVFNFENGIIEQALKLPVDSIVFGDDWGTQQGLLVSPEIWRKVFKPRYAEQFELIHKSGKKVWFHSCGNIYEIIGDFIEIGVDVLELLQPDLLGVEKLADDFGGNVCFCCSVDHQRRAISGARQEIFDYAHLLNDKLGAYNGGFIAYIEDYASLGMSEQNYQWIREAFGSINNIGEKQ